MNDQIDLREKEKQRIEYENKVRTYTLLAGIAIFMLIAFLLFRNNLHRKKANELLQQQKQEIGTQKKNVEDALSELKSTQAQLIQ